MIPVRFHDAARSELAEEVLYYAEIDRRLGERLAQAVERTVALAAEFPEMGSPYKFGTRRVFPPEALSVLCRLPAQAQRDLCPRGGTVPQEAWILEVAQA